MFKRWFQILCAAILLIGIYSGVQFYFVHQRYLDYAETLNECSNFERRLIINGGEWSIGQKNWWESTCDHSKEFSDAKMKYDIYRDLNENQENSVRILSGILALFAVSFIARWLFTGEWVRRRGA